MISIWILVAQLSVPPTGYKVWDIYNTKYVFSTKLACEKIKETGKMPDNVACKELKVLTDEDLL